MGMQACGLKGNLDCLKKYSKEGITSYASSEVETGQKIDEFH